MTAHPIEEYRYREGAHGEHCVVRGIYEWRCVETIGRAASKGDAQKIIGTLNAKEPQ